MTRLHWCVVVAAAMVCGCADTSPDAQLRESAADALGGAERLRGLTIVTLEGHGRAGNLGQDMTWEATGQEFELTEVRRVLDLTGPRGQVQQTRTPNFLYYLGPQPQRQVTGFDREIAYSVGPSGNVARQAGSVARDRRIEFYHHPLTMVRAMLEPATSISNIQTDGGGRSADVQIGDSTFAVHFDQRHLLMRVASPTSHPNMGDVTLTTEFAGYEAVDDMMLPRQLTMSLDGRRTTQLQVERYVFDAGADALAPPAAASAAEPSPLTPSVEATPVAPGVWLLAGQSHHSALVEFADHLMLIEAPQSEARTLAVIARARELVPLKPLTELVLSHHHFDHSSGLRAAVAEGLTIITHQADAAFVDEMVKRPHTRQPDALQKNPRPLTVRTVDVPLTLADASMTVVLHPIAGNPHGDTMLLAYLPAQRIVIQADAYSPGGSYHPYAANLLEVIRKNNLIVERIVPLHGSVVPFDALIDTVAAQRQEP